MKRKRLKLTAMSTNWYHKNKHDPLFQEKRRAYLREYRTRNPAKILEIAKRSYHKRKADLGRACPTEKCPICLQIKKLVWDHNHTTGVFRGWLCRQCNAALGLIGDNYDSVSRLMAYLQGVENGF